jgi:hypothetical protein
MLIPATLFLTFARNDRAARQWLKTDQARHIQLLADIRAGRFAETNGGHALKALAARLPQQRASAIMAYAELNIEMVLRAEELMLVAQESGSVYDGSPPANASLALQLWRQSLPRLVLHAMICGSFKASAVAHLRLLASPIVSSPIVYIMSKDAPGASRRRVAKGQRCPGRHFPTKGWVETIESPVIYADFDSMSLTSDVRPEPSRKRASSRAEHPINPALSSS